MVADQLSAGSHFASADSLAPQAPLKKNTHPTSYIYNERAPAPERDLLSDKRRRSSTKASFWPFNNILHF